MQDRGVSLSRYGVRKVSDTSTGAMGAVEIQAGGREGRDAEYQNSALRPHLQVQCDNYNTWLFLRSLYLLT